MGRKQAEKMLLVCILLMLSYLASMQLEPVKAELIVTNEIDLEVEPGRILPDPQNNCYWITAWLSGLLCASENQPGVWIIEMYPGYEVVDAVGPTSEGYIYCTYESEQLNPIDTGIVIFDTATRQYVGTIDLPWEYGLSAITISSDEERLYVTVLTTDAGADSLEEASENSGLVVEVGIASGNVLRTASVRAWPETIFLWEDDKILVSCQKGYWVEFEDDQVEMKSTTDIVSLDSFTKIVQIPSGAGVILGTNDFIQMDSSTVWLLNAVLNSDFDDPNFEDALWIIDPVTGSVIETFPVSDSYGREHGVKRAYRSHQCPDLVYLALMEDMNFGYGDPRVIVTDINGIYIDSHWCPGKKLT